MERWVANKFGLFNFWYYDDEEFELSNGKIIFRGTNGSGKSVTTQSFIPLLFDGDKQPNRLDPFGSKARKIENYVLVSEDDEDRISYLYLEFKKEKSNSFITIGMGLRGRKGKKLDSWYFILKDGRRINHELKLYNFSGEKYPFTAKQLENVLGEGNVFTTSQKEYMEKVNEHLFAYSDIDNYKDLLTLLIQLRSPKLSKDFKPTVIYEILKGSLNTLSEDDLRTMAEAMDNMDNLNTKLDELKNSIDACKKIKKVFNNYNLRILYDKSSEYILKKNDVENLKLLVENSEASLINKKETIQLKCSNLGKLNDKLQQAKEKEKHLRENKGFILRNEITKLSHEINILQNENKKKQEKHKEKYETKFKRETEIKKLDANLYNEVEKYSDLLQDEEFYREECFFYHGETLKNIPHKKGTSVFKDILSNIDEYDNIVGRAYHLISDYERLNKEFNNLDEKKYRQSENVKSKENILRESEEYLTNVKSEYIDKINFYISGLKELYIEKDSLINIYKEINQIHKVIQCNNISTIIGNITDNLKTVIKEKELLLRQNMKVVDKNINDIQYRIDELTNSKEIIIQDEEIQNTKKLLDIAKVQYEDFYKLINFKSNIAEKERNLIEGNLYNMGILTSLIIPIKYKEKALNVLKGSTFKVIFSDLSAETDNIGKFFNLENNKFINDNKEEVKNILSAIALTESQSNKTYLSIENGFGIGIIKGDTNEKYNTKFIGLESREAYRKNQINKLEEEKNNLVIEKDTLNSEINLLLLRHDILIKESSEFPKTLDIQESINIIEENIKILDSENRELERLNEKIFTLKQEIEKLKRKLYALTEHIKIPQDKLSYEKAIENIREYRKSVSKLKDIALKIENYDERLEQFKGYLEEIILDLDNINEEIYNLKEKINNKNNTLTALQDSLKACNLGEIEEEIKTITEIINEYPKKIIAENRIIERKETEIQHLTESLKIDKNKLMQENNILQALYNILKKELNLSYIEEISEVDFNNSIKWIMKNYENTNSSNDDEVTILFNVFGSNKGYILDYHPKVEDIFNNYNETEDSTINKILKSSVRKDIKISFNKKEISIFQLVNYLEGALEEQKILINENEREVFEEILINTLSTKINAKIYKAKGWVSEIDTLMKNMNTSSGFKLHLTWKAKKAESEEELDIKELTEILSKPNFMTDDERIKVSKHFKEKLKKQRRIASDDGSKRSYQSIIKDVLDYRDWFEFQLYFSKPTERNKELTDNEFFKLSGGEKAMAMYIPLFAAVNARYNAADKKDCPRIISLDEAFAGVDEENISNMFTLIEGLNLDYVLNSQVLWGTYASVKSLSIYELIRHGEDVILPIKYHWDGKMKTIEMNK